MSTKSLSSESVRVPALDQLEGIDEGKLFRKLDLRILPLVSLLYLLSFLDRTNIGNANVAGLSKDLRLVGLQYNICSAIFFIPYCLFEVPSNLAIKRFSPGVWLALIMIIWGIIVISQGFVKKFQDLAAARFFLGVAEAGLLPGASFYISQWYPRRVLSSRLTLFISSTTLAGAFGGLLAYGIDHMDGARGIAGWRWIFIIEGIATVLGAVLAFVFLPHYPEKATFLTEAERSYLLLQLRDASSGKASALEWSHVKEALTDYKSYLLSLTFLTIVIPAYCYALFSPTIINGLGYAPAKAQALSTPPYICACILTIILGQLSDHYRLWGPFIMVIQVVGIIGYAVMMSKTSSLGAGYGASYVAAMGLFPNIAATITWAGMNTKGDTKRSVVLAMVIGLGNLGGVASSFVFRAKDAPRYIPGYSTAIGSLAFSFCLVAFQTWNYRRLNKLQAAALKNQDTWGNDKKEYRYIL